MNYTSKSSFTMTATQRYIEDVIKGGWSVKGSILVQLKTLKLTHGRQDASFADLHQALLDPAAWQAAGKVRGWVQGDFEVCFGCGVRITNTTPDKKSGKHYSCKSDIEWWPSQAAFEQVQFMNRIAVDGKTIEEALTAIE